MKKLIVILMLLVYSISILPINTLALTKTRDSSYEELSATKISVLDSNKVGEYDIKIKVPGKEKTAISGYNFLFVVDASTSTNGTKWNSMRQAIIDVVDVLLPNNDSTKNINKVALMTFGIGEHLNVSLTSDKTKFSSLPTNAGQSMLLPGRSATNNEVGLSGAYKYLNNLSSDLKKNANRTYVLYLTDGRSNLNEKEVNYYEVAKNNYWSLIRQESFRTLLYFHYYSEVNRDSVISDVLASVNDVNETLLEDCVLSIKEVYETVKADTTLSNSEKNNKINSEVNNIINNILNNNEDISNIINNYIEKQYELMGYTDKTKLYSAGEYERMINSYQYSSDIDFQQVAENPLYYPIFAVGGNRLENANRAIEAGMKLKNIATIYTIGYGTKASNTGILDRDDANKIMIPEYSGFTDKNYGVNTKENHFSSGYYYTTISSVVEVFKKLTMDLVYTNYVNTTITDYTSKWVIPMDINNDNIFDEKDIVVKNNDEVVEANISVTKLSNDEINASTDQEVLGNKENNIYKIIWNLPDKFKQDDHYELSYRVKVDTQEEGFVSNQDYKANGVTNIKYDVVETSLDGEKTIADDVFNNIEVPTVKQKENVVIITKKDDSGALLKGADFKLVSNNKINQIKVYYSTDGTNWTNNKENATYFKFTGMYDDLYEIVESAIPEGYTVSNQDLSYDFTNKEGQKEEVVIVNSAKKGKVTVKYFILIDGEYIPLSEYATDENNNKTPDFEDVSINDLVIEDKLGSEFSTEYREIKEYKFVGLYKEKVSKNNKLEGNIFSGTVNEEEQTFIYVYEPPMGSGNIPPVTGIENDLSIYAKILLFITFSAVFGYSVKKYNE